MSCDESDLSEEEEIGAGSEEDDYCQMKNEVIELLQKKIQKREYKDQVKRCHKLSKRALVKLETKPLISNKVLMATLKKIYRKIKA